ncbi:hypothetical protein X943_001141 [Babesia divergens]|uniref:Pre-rRNA-processing protein Ipi1 N-terminal domain-containing protein n=1 Tax=Babesia divergens TaxID=32595 RepID=A0AAD9GHB2_BABDI|nr:hypothetical protein X943_001141 [Babesia divergens]
MKVKKTRDFTTKKVRVGKQHLRKHESSDAKLLSNIGRLKKSVKVATQSIAVNKDSLNVTSRRLTLAELIGKSRHASDSVRHHALLGILEFTRRFVEDTRINLYLIVQVAASSLTNSAAAVRKQGKALLLSLITNHLNSTEGEGNKCAECLMLHLTQAILSSHNDVREDAYQTIVAISSKTPSILAEYAHQLLSKLVRNHPSIPTAVYVDCLYALFKGYKDHDVALSSELVGYLYKVIEASIAKGENETTELGCLSTTSMVVKSFKMLLLNIEGIKPDDVKLIQCLMYFDFFQYEGLTERGKQTFDTLFAEFILTKAEIAIRCMGIFKKYYLALMVPLIHLHSLRNTFNATHADRIAEIILAASSLDITGIPPQSVQSLRVQWRQNLYKMLSAEEPIFYNIRQIMQTHLAVTKMNSHTFGTFDKLTATSEVQSGDIVISDIMPQLCRNMALSLSNDFEILPIVALINGVSPVIWLEECYSSDSKQHHFKFLGKLPMNFETTLNLELDCDSILENFVSRRMSKVQSSALLKTLLHISKHPKHIIGARLIESYLRLERIRELHEEELCLIARLMLNCTCSREIAQLIGEIVKAILADTTLCSYKAAVELVNVMVFHLVKMIPGINDKVIGIDEHLMAFNRIIGYIAEGSAILETNINEDSINLIELILAQCVNRTLDGILRSNTNNIWSVIEGQSLIFKRCFEPVCEVLTGNEHWNTALCIANSALPMKHTSQASEKGKGKDLQSDETGRSPWMEKLLEAVELKIYSPVLLNRLPAADSPRAAVQTLCDMISRIIM